MFRRPSRRGRPLRRGRAMCHLCTGSRSSGTLAERRRCSLRSRRAWRRFLGVLPGVNGCSRGIVEMSALGDSSSLMCTEDSLPFQNCSGSETSGSISHRARSASSGVCQSTHPVLRRGVGDLECVGGGGIQFHCGPHYTLTYDYFGTMDFRNGGTIQTKQHMHFGITMQYSIFKQKNKNIAHEIGRRKGCASVFLENKSALKSHIDVRCTHNTYLSKSTTLGSLKSR